ncbi:hypothetical protein [Occultella gossypii]|uniref:Uncharacterized protein n=1 Tax=Occultella gossypii TaxID=2800820 RepID=A0ABS7S430_9MICO|nr:hypothetical protein [Occultella gossypii]MBZ2195093.1 hypothetical protein [Occultella gossypii]
MGHLKEPVVVGLWLGGAEPVVTISEGSGHLGSGGAMWLEEVLTESGGLQQRWEQAFAQAGALWVVPFLGRVAAGEQVAEDEIVNAYRQRHGTEPAVRVSWHA